MTNHDDRLLVIIMGPTAVGKTALAIDLAAYFETDIISADSRQFYVEMNIGTAKPTSSQLQEVKHYFINSLHVSQAYSVGKYEEEATLLIDKLFQQKKILIVVGGSGLYINALCDGIDTIPSVSAETKAYVSQLYQDKGMVELLSLLKKYDPLYYDQVDHKNTQRVTRAVEVCLETQMSFSSFRKGVKTQRSFKLLKIGLQKSREQLYQSINQRVDDMVQQGLVDEVKSLVPYKDANALQTVGYTEFFSFLDGAYSLEEAIALIKKNTRRYAKRQLTWFRKDPEIHWFDVTQVSNESIRSHIISFLK